MKRQQRYQGFMAALILGLALVLGAGALQPAYAGTEDAAMFYDELAQYGDWVDYENYGPVWYPNQVDQDWRPYVNGRWVPTEQGQVFETQEAWGWATYHYGNWMPTEAYGWVWVPGRTWYPSTVTWRTSPESTAPEKSYVGWAPIPPPNYEPPPAYQPENYYPGMPAASLITAPLYIFAAATSFMLGLGQPYTPAYSYYNAGVLVPPAYVPVIYPTAPVLTSFYTPSYYPATFVGAGLGFGAYAFGPSPTYISRVTNINQTVINNTVINNTRNITRINNVRAPRNVIDRHQSIRRIQPPVLTRGQGNLRVRPAHNVRRAEANLGKPNILRTPKDAPKFTAKIPKVTKAQAAAMSKGRGPVGTALPSKATKKLTPQQQAQINKLPPNKRIKPEGRPTTAQRQQQQQQRLTPEQRRQQQQQQQKLTPEQRRQQQQQQQKLTPEQRRQQQQQQQKLTPEQRRQQQQQQQKLTPEQRRQQQQQQQKLTP
ncbi:MAG: DUF6600 domain-containing protein, partial [Thermodesulfobacteriota bacterium]